MEIGIRCNKKNKPCHNIKYNGFTSSEVTHVNANIKID